MDLADGLSLLAILISFGTFAVTTYEQYLKSAKLQVVLGSQIWLLRQGPGTLGFWSSVALVNQGAVDAVILRISGRLSRENGEGSVAVHWRALGGYASEDTPGDSPAAGPRFAVKDWTETLVASSRKAETNWIAFALERVPTPGPQVPAARSGLEPDTTYNLDLEVFVPDTRRGWPGGTGERLAATWSGTFCLSADETAALAHPAPGHTPAPGRAVAADMTGGSRRSPVASIPSRPPLEEMRLPE